MNFSLQIEAINVISLICLTHHIDASEGIGPVLICFSTIICLYVLLQGFLIQLQQFLLVLFVVGFLILVNGEASATIWQALCLSIVGALVSVYAHFQNLKLKQLHAHHH